MASGLVRRRDLLSALQRVPEFPAPSFELEQYKTSAELAADILYAVAASYGGLSGALVADLGCGTGVLGIGAAVLGATVLGVDIDAAALAVAADAADDLGLVGRVELVRLDVAELGRVLGAGGVSSAGVASSGGGESGGGGVMSASGGPASQAGPLRRVASTCAAESAGASATPLDDGSDGAAAAAAVASAAAAVRTLHGHAGLFDVVILNPPFGTRAHGADVAFVRAALLLAAPHGAVYSLHKSSTRAHLVRTARALRVGVELVAELRFPIPATYAFHRERSADVAVDLLRWLRGPPEAVRACLARADRIPAYEPPQGAATASRRGGRR